MDEYGRAYLLNEGDLEEEKQAGGGVERTIVMWRGSI
jgi:hypothetical protein